MISEENEKSDTNLHLDNQTLRGSKKGSTYDFDVILEHLGGLGRFQVLLIVFGYYGALPVGMHSLAAVFIFAVPQHRCHIPGIDNDDVYASYSERYLMNISTPMSDVQGQNGCEMYDYNYTSCTNGTFDCLDFSSRPPSLPCKSYVYSKDEYGTTAVVEWDLVCDRLLIGTSVISTYYFGSTIGLFIGGNIMDNFGRRYVMLLSIIGVIVAGISCAFSPSFLLFSISRCLIALFMSVNYAAGFVYVTEITFGKWHTIAGLNFQSCFAFGYVFLSVVAYIWKDWRNLQMVITLLSVPFIFMWIFMPESPRWLFAKSRNKEGRVISELIARRNGVTLPENIWNKASEKLQIHQDRKRYHSVLTLFRRRRMRIITFIMVFCSFVVSLTYYGLSLNVGAFSGDVYVNNALGGIVEIVAFPIVTILLQKFGRNKPLSVSYLFAGVMCLTVSLMTGFSDGASEPGMLATVLSLCGRLAISAAFTILFCYAAELYPTVVRGTAIGLISTSAVVASVVTPYALYLQYFVSWLPGAIFGAASILAGIASFKLPDTKNCRLMTTLDEAEEFCSRAWNGRKKDNSMRLTAPSAQQL